MSKLALFGGKPQVSTPPQLAGMYREEPFAERFAAYIGSRHALPAASGTGALCAALIGAGVRPGDEVITVSHTWFCTATSILAVGAVPVFADVEPVTFTLDPAEIERRVTPRTRAVLGVSLYGHPARYDLINPIAKRLGLVVIDDACQATGAAIEGRKLGLWADVTAFSFSGKPLVSTGGGAITTDDRMIYERAMLAGQHPSFISTHAKNPAIHAFAATGGYGMNNRIDGGCAQRAFAELEKLDAINEWRRANAHHLVNRLRGLPGITPPTAAPGAFHVYHMFTFLFDGSAHGLTRDEVMAALLAEGLPAIAYIGGANFLKDLKGRAWAPGPLHRRPLFQMLAREGRCGPYILPDGPRPSLEAPLPVTERLTATEINLPQKWINPPFGRARMDEYADAIEKVMTNLDELRDAKARGALPTGKHNFLTSCESDG